MATTAPAAWAACRSRLETAAGDGSVTIPLRWQNETREEVPADQAFAFMCFEVMPQDVASYGGGRGNTRWRSWAELIAYIVVPKGYGLHQSMLYAEEIAAVFRGKQFGGVSCFGATVQTSPLTPEGFKELGGNYDVAACVVDLRFDQIG